MNIEKILVAGIVIFLLIVLELLLTGGKGIFGL